MTPVEYLQTLTARPFLAAQAGGGGSMIFDRLATALRNEGEVIFLAIAVLIGVSFLFTKGETTKIIGKVVIAVGAAIFVFAPTVLEGIATTIAGWLPGGAG